MKSRRGFGADTTDQTLQYTIQQGDSVQSISNTTGDSIDDLISLNPWLNNFTTGESLAPVSDGGNYDGNNYAGQQITYYNPNYTAPSSAPASSAATVAPAQSSSSSGLLSALTNIVTGAGNVVVGTAAKAAGVTTQGQSISQMMSQQNWMLYAGIAGVVVLGGFFLLQEKEEASLHARSNPKRRRK